MNFLNPYSKAEYKKFFQDSLLTDSFRIIEEEISLEFKPQFINKAYLIGKDKSLELEVYEIQHNSEYDPRVGISKDFFRLMARYGSKRALAIFHSPNSKNYRLSLATVELSLDGSKIKKEYSNPRRFSFFLGPDAKVHTPYNYLVKKERVKDFDDLQNRFSIEVVNKEFYKEIANWYFWALKKVKFPADSEAEKNGREISVIRLITRLIFIWFMKVRKLVPEDLFNENSLKQILTDFKLSNENFYKAILQNLFFATLNTKQEERRFTSKKKGYKGFSQDFGNHNVYRYEELFSDSEEIIEKYFMSIPFLNGGLFECLDYKTKTRDERKYIDGFTSTKSQQPIVPNFLFFSDDKEIDLNKDYGTTNKKYNVRGLINTLSLYNFTIDESDPNDADVALDPELLGKVFENLLASYNPETAKTARKSTGSYYTPRPIVDYMVDESLKQYFKTHMETGGIDNKLSTLFSGEEQVNPFDTAHTKKLVNLIDSLRVVDPAVGSGAFPMRILNRLVFLLHKLDPDNVLWKQSQIEGIKKSVKDITLQRKFIEETERKFKEKNPNYGRKLYLIEKCIYGVDIQQIAVEIAKLRFFISLLVDEKVENGEIEPLPNLDFKLMQGNSLISSFAGIDFTTKPQNDDNLFDFDEKYKQLIDEFEELKSQYQNEPDVHKKRKLRDDIDAKLLEIFEEKLKQHYPQLKDLESKYSGRKEIIEAEKKKLFKKIGIDLNQAEQDLIAYSEGRKQKDFFLWDVYFAEVFGEKRGFDIIIGNPPYISYYSGQAAEISEEDYNYYLINYDFIENKRARNRIGTVMLFLEKALKLLNYKSTSTFIIDINIFSDSFIPIRKYLHDKISINFIISNLSEFENVGSGQIILSFRKIYDENHLIKYFTDFTNKEFLHIKESKINSENNYSFKFSRNEIVISKLRNNSVPLTDVAEIISGMNIGGVKEYFLSEKRKDKSYHKAILSGNIFRYKIDYPNVVQNNNPRNNFIRFDKKIEKYIWDNKIGTPSIGEDDEKFKKNKILLRRPLTGDGRLAAAYSEDPDHYSDVTVYIINYKNLSLKYLLGLINSKLGTFICREMGIIRFEKGQQPQITINRFKQFPVRLLNQTQQNKFISIVDNIVSTKQKDFQADTKHLEEQIDIMVYKLYDLTYEEVKIMDPELEKIISEKEYEKFSMN